MNGMGGGGTGNNNMNDSMYSMLLNGSTNMSSGTFNMNNNMNHTGLATSASNSDVQQQQLINMDSFRNNSLMGLPIRSFHMTNGGSSAMMDSQQQHPPPGAATLPQPTSGVAVGVPQQQYSNNGNIATNNSFIQQQQLQLQQHLQQFMQPTPIQQQPYEHQKRQLSSTFITTSTAGSSNPASKEEKQNFDRRRVFAKMKYTRPPSVQHVSGGTDASTTNILGVVAAGGDSTEAAPPLQQQQHYHQQHHPSTAVDSINALGTMTTTATGMSENYSNPTSDDQLLNFHLMESNLGMETSTMSFFSTLSNPLPSANNINYTNAGVGVVSGIQPHHHYQQQQPSTMSANSISNNNDTAAIPSYNQQMYMLQKQHEQLFNVSNNLTYPKSDDYDDHNNTSSEMHLPGATTIDTGYSKVVVETAKVVDKSSGRLNSTNSSNNYLYHNNNNYDAMSIGSRLSMMSGLSRISDGNENDSIFSDLSKKIGNVSTRSMAMSEMSALEIQELNDEDDADDAAEEDLQQQRQGHYHHKRDVDVSSSATLTMDDVFSK